jgi:hypothetical protein
MPSNRVLPVSTLALASSFYTVALERPFGQSLARHGLPHTVVCIPYNQMHTFLLHPNSAIPDDDPRNVILLLRVEDLIRMELAVLGPGPEAAGACIRVFRERTEQFLEVLGQMSHLCLGVMICPSGRGAFDTSFLGNVIRAAEHKIAAELRRQQRHLVISWSEFEGSGALANWFNPSGDRLGHVPFSPEGLDALASFLVGKLDEIPSNVPARTMSGHGIADLGRFLSTLNVQMPVAPMAPEDEREVLNVLRHTTHFINLPHGKWDSGVSGLMASVPGGEAWTIRVRDRFGDYGVSGVLIFAVECGVMRVGLLFLTCPVLGKQVEYALISWVADIAERQGVHLIQVPFVSGRDNHGFQTFLTRMGAEEVRTGSDRFFSIPVRGLSDRAALEAPDPASARAIFPTTQATA